jgi:hypothetical protein
MNKQAKKNCELYQKLASPVTKPVQRIQIVQKSFSQKMKMVSPKLKQNSFSQKKDNVFTFLLCWTIFLPFTDFLKTSEKNLLPSDTSCTLLRLEEWKFLMSWPFFSKMNHNNNNQVQIRNNWVYKSPLTHMHVCVYARMPGCFGVHSQIGNRLFDKPQQSRSGKKPSKPYI